MIKYIVNANTIPSIMMMTVVAVGSFTITYHAASWLLSMVV